MIEKEPLRYGRGRATSNEQEFMPLSFGTFGKAVAILIIAAFVAWLIFTYMFASEEAAEEAESVGAVHGLQGPPLA